MDNEKRVQILLILALLLNVGISVLDLIKEERTNTIEENLAYALDENIVATRTHEKVATEAIALVDAHLSYVHVSLSSNNTESKRKKRDLDEKTTRFIYKGINLSEEYNRSLSNSTELKDETEKLRDTRDAINKIRPWLDLLSFIILFMAVYFTLRQENYTKNLLVEIKRDNQELKDSIKQLEDLLIEVPEEAWINKGRTLYGQGKYDEAIQAYDKAIEINPQHADAWNSKGIVLMLLGRTIEADAAFAKAKELGLQPDPSFV